MYGRTLGLLVASAAALHLCGGCGAPPARPPGKPLPLGAIYDYHFPGIAGDSDFDRRWTDALVEGGAADRVEICDWTCNQRWLGCLYSDARNRAEAARAAQRIAQRRAADPGARLDVTAESAGGGIALWALERLPAGVFVDDVILVSPAVSPDFDLTAALQHVRGKIYYFDSPIDVLTLAVGTGIFGTIDQKRTLGAGLVGFHVPTGADRSAYARLVEVRYDLAWMRWGYAGTHLSGMSSAFALNVVAPMLVRDERTAWGDGQSIARTPPPEPRRTLAQASRTGELVR